MAEKGSKVAYEWIVEFLADDGDIEETTQWDSYADAVKCQLEGGKSDLGLVRDFWYDDGTLVSREWAYVKDGKLPEYFGDGLGNDAGGSKVPQRFHKEITG